MEPHLSGKDKQMFYKYLDKATHYFEFGSGGSTYQASLRPNIKHIITVESDKHWLDKLKTIIPVEIQSKRITFILNDMDTLPNNWGNPGPKATVEQKKSYSEHIRSLPTLIKEDPLNTKIREFLIFIDGRFRVACCLKSHAIENATVIFDDFLDRPQYHVVLNYFDVVEKTTDKRMVVLRKKTNTLVPPELIAKYELIHG